jgi:hypothetical protein
MSFCFLSVNALEDKKKPQGQQFINDIGCRYNLSHDAVVPMLICVNNGGGRLVWDCHQSRKHVRGAAADRGYAMLVSVPGVCGQGLAWRDPDSGTRSRATGLSQAARKGLNFSFPTRAPLHQGPVPDETSCVAKVVDATIWTLLWCAPAVPRRLPDSARAVASGYGRRRAFATVVVRP